MGTSSSTMHSNSTGAASTAAASAAGGNASGAASAASSVASVFSSNIAKRDKHIKKKFESATKTGVLNLSDLKLKANQTFWVELSAPGMIAHLKTLDLSGNSLKALPPEVYALVNLKALFMTGCGIHAINDMHSMTRLSKLKLDHNDLEVDRVRRLPLSLTTLDLSYNHLLGLPASLNGLTNLISLDLACNRIESIYGIEGMPNLVSLNLDDNLLLELPGSICLLVKLKKISLARNRFTKHSVTRPGEQSIPAGLLENSELDHIDLTGNVGISKADVMAFVGIEKFLARRQALKDKNFQGGALADCSLFGLE